jgi:hypothetical protein
MSKQYFFNEVKYQHFVNIPSIITYLIYFVEKFTIQKIEYKVPCL